MNGLSMMGFKCLVQTCLSKNDMNISIKNDLLILFDSCTRLQVILHEELGFFFSFRLISEYSNRIKTNLIRDMS